MKTTPKQLVSGAVKLLSLPEVYLRLDELMKDKHSGAKQLGEVICNDPAVSARLLKIVNSAFYGFPAKIDNLSRAVSIIGIHQLRELVLSTVAVSTFNRISTDLVDMSTFWHHSVYCGLIARILARRCNVLHPDRLFTAGLLHDIGQLIIYHEIPDLARTALRVALASDDGLFHAERHTLGFTHADVGAELFKLWNLPASLQEVAQYHHQPSKAKDFPLETAIVHMANSATNRIEPARNIINCRAELDPVVFECTGLSEDVLEHALAEAHPQFLDVIEVISSGRVQT